MTSQLYDASMQTYKYATLIIVAAPSLICSSSGLSDSACHGLFAVLASSLAASSWWPVMSTCAGTCIWTR